ncbi:MAG: hypothetical protein HKN80_05860 [Acidimicrobiia bacterium]|nr:hypothetical protein [Acidimicrobiia bacterium]
MALLAGACSSGPSLTEYAEELEVIVSEHNGGMDENDRYIDAEAPTLERVRTYATRRLELRNTFVTRFEGLEPPREAEDLHSAAVEVIRSLVDAEQALFEQATTTEDLNAIDNLWASPAGQTAREADRQTIAICQAAEAAINSTEERQALVGMPWVPTELQEVVTVAFGCTEADR